MRKTLLCLLLSVSTTALAQSWLGGFARGWSDAAREDARQSAIDPRQWERASLTGQEATGDYRYQKCHYQTINGLDFSIMQRNQCPMAVFFNPESGEVRKP